MTKHPSNKSVIFAVALLFGVLLCGCRSDTQPKWIHFENVDSNGWSREHPMTFMPYPEDSAEIRHSRYDIDLILRYGSRHPLKSVPMAIEFENDKGTLRVDTLSVALANQSGQHLGKFSNGIYTLEIPLAKAQTLSEGYSISLQPLMEAEHTRGLLNVGIRLNPAK